MDQYTTNFDVMGGFSAGVEIIKGLRFTTSFSGNYTGRHNFTHTPVYYSKWFADGSPDSDYGNPRNSMEESRAVSSNYTWDNVFNFDRTFGKHGIQATLGHSWMREFYRTQGYSTINDLGATNITGFSDIDGKISASDSTPADGNSCCRPPCAATNPPSSTKTTAPDGSPPCPWAGISIRKNGSRALPSPT